MQKHFLSDYLNYCCLLKISTVHRLRDGVFVQGNRKVEVKRLVRRQVEAEVAMNGWVKGVRWLGVSGDWLVDCGYAAGGWVSDPGAHGKLGSRKESQRLSQGESEHPLSLKLSKQSPRE